MPVGCRLESRELVFRGVMMLPGVIRADMRGNDRNDEKQEKNANAGAPKGIPPKGLCNLSDAPEQPGFLGVDAGRVQGPFRRRLGLFVLDAQVFHSFSTTRGSSRPYTMSFMKFKPRMMTDMRKNAAWETG